MGSCLALAREKIPCAIFTKSSCSFKSKCCIDAHIDNSNHNSPNIDTRSISTITDAEYVEELIGRKSKNTILNIPVDNSNLHNEQNGSSIEAAANEATAYRSRMLRP